jgi:hypothetical protein
MKTQKRSRDIEEYFTCDLFNATVSSSDGTTLKCKLQKQKDNFFLPIFFSLFQIITKFINKQYHMKSMLIFVLLFG